MGLLLGLGVEVSNGTVEMTEPVPNWLELSLMVSVFPGTSAST